MDVDVDVAVEVEVQCYLRSDKDCSMVISKLILLIQVEFLIIRLSSSFLLIPHLLPNVLCFLSEGANLSRFALDVE